MLGPELTPRTTRRERRRSAREGALAREHEELFVLLATLRAASAEALHALHFAEHPGGGSSMRSTYRWLAILEDADYLERQFINGPRSVYRMTNRAYGSSQRVRRRATETVRRPMTEAIASYCWLRASVWAELKNRGHHVGRGREELRAVRRFLIDNQRRAVASATGPAQREAERVLQTLRADPNLTPLFRSRCGACGGEGPLSKALESCVSCQTKPTQVACELRFECPQCGRVSDREETEHRSALDVRRICTQPLREVDHVPFDVAWRDGTHGIELTLIVVDDPGRSLRDQLNVLPLRVAGQPVVPIVLRTTDEHSVYDPVTSTWTAKGTRHRELLRAFSDDGDRRLFPFSTTARVIDVRPELQMRIRPSRVARNRR